ncbi:SMI1/KNR4 family protein [Streptomyces sp. NPDC050418]|uniref:SMI1/KNR4 family protein n=1 Tax=Streptomyces sp. NPDC050418 TaxID=3365612 RepID=UPI0037954919
MVGGSSGALGERERFRPASREAWDAVEAWVGRELPAEYKEFVDGYGDAVLCGHLFVPHPEGSDRLLTFMEQERRDFHSAFQDVRGIPTPVKDSWNSIIPWAYHDWNGDVCLLVPEPESGNWTVAVAFRQCPEVWQTGMSLTNFLQSFLLEKKFPRGWPVRDAQWTSMPGSSLL